MKNMLPLLTLLLVCLPLVSATTNLDFRLDANQKAYYPNESISLNVSVINRDMNSVAKDAVMTIHVGDRDFYFSIGNLHPSESIQEYISLPEFPPGTHSVRGELNYTGILDEKFTEVTYGSFEVLYPPIQRFPRNVYISDYQIPEKIIEGKEYGVNITIENDGDVSADLVIEFGSVDSFYEEKTTLNPKQSTTVHMNVKFDNLGISLIEARVYAIIDGEKYLLNYNGKKTYTQTERKAKLVFDRVELFNEDDNLINKNDNVKLKIYVRNQGDTATYVTGELISETEGIHILNSNISYFTILNDESFAPERDAFVIETTGSLVGNLTLKLLIRYYDSEIRETKLDVPILISDLPEICNEISCTKNQSLLSLGNTCSCGYIAPNNKCVNYECCSDNMCKENNICNLKSHKCEKVISNFSADVLIITRGSKIDKQKGYEEAIKSYREALLNDGYSSFYIEIDSSKLDELFGIKLTNTEDWNSYKNVIDKIVYKIKPSYILILGGVDVIPQPFIKNSCFKDMNLDSLPTDDLYADTNQDKKPDVAIGRIPTTGSNLIKYLNRLSEIHAQGIQFKKETLLGDDCLTDDCFEEQETHDTSKLLFGTDCTKSGKCLWSPPHCETTGMPPITPIPCSKSIELYQTIEKSDFTYLVLHGDGTAFYSMRIKVGGVPIIGDTVLSSLGISGFLEPKNPSLIMALSCLGGAIDVSSLCLFPGACLYPQITGTFGTAKSLTDKGATYIANTRYGLSGYSTTQLTTTYHNIKDRQEIGKALLNMKSEMLKYGSNECWLATVYQIQLYGDPTLKYKGE